MLALALTVGLAQDEDVAWTLGVACLVFLVVWLIATGGTGAVLALRLRRIGSNIRFSWRRMGLTTTHFVATFALWGLLVYDVVAWFMGQLRIGLVLACVLLFLLAQGLHRLGTDADWRA